MRRVTALLAICAILPVAAHAGDFQPGRGFLESLRAPLPRYAWSIADGISFTDRYGPGIAPGDCVGVCPYNFSNDFWGVTESGDYQVQVFLHFSGPTVTAITRCGPYGCPPDHVFGSYANDWADVPITLTGEVHLISRIDPFVIFHYLIAGSGTARAETRQFAVNEGESHDYNLLRYEFTYDVVPEPRTAALFLFGTIAIGATSLTLRRRRGAARA